ncbi:MAG: PQQ-dependent catabolism-associated CXXCW motif protein, partial [Mesorhizobium sp.]
MNGRETIFLLVAASLLGLTEPTWAG